MYQAPSLIQTLASIGITVEATETHITVLSLNQEWLAAAHRQQQQEEDLEAMRLRWYGSPETVQADFHRMVMQAEVAWEEAEAAEAEYDWSKMLAGMSCIIFGDRQQPRYSPSYQRSFAYASRLRLPYHRGTSRCLSRSWSIRW